MRLHRTIFVFLALIGAIVVFGCSGDQQVMPGGEPSPGGIESPEVTGPGSQELPDDDGVIEDPDVTQVGPNPVEITSTSLKPGDVGNSYLKKTLHAKGGSCGKKVCTYLWEATGLPKGLSLTGCHDDPAATITGKNACVQGTPATEGTHEVLLTATDEGDPSLADTRNLTLIVNPAPDPGEAPPEQTPYNAFLSTIQTHFKDLFGPHELTIVRDKPKPFSIHATSRINVQPNVDLQGNNLRLKFHAEGGCGEYTWEFDDGPMGQEKQWSYQRNDPDTPCAETEYCQVLSDIKPILRDFNLDPVHWSSVKVTDKCGNHATMPIELIYVYPPDVIKPNPETGGDHVRLCLKVDNMDNWGDSGQQFHVWLTGTNKDGDCKEDIHAGKCDVAEWWVQAFDHMSSWSSGFVMKGDDDDPGMAPEELKMTAKSQKKHHVSDAPELAKYYKLWLSVGKRGCAHTDQDKSICPDENNPDIGLEWIRVATKHWWLLFLDAGDLIAEDEEPFDRDLSYSIKLHNASGGIWVRRPIGYPNVCDIPSVLPQLDEGKTGEATNADDCILTEEQIKKGAKCL